MSMFSSFTQFLPSAIQNTIASHAPPPAPELEEVPPPPSNFDPSTDDEGDEEELIRLQSRKMDDQQDDRRKVKSKKEKDPAKSATETFIFVRPPPSKTNHPLNLQVQLVPPTARGPSGVGGEPTTPRSASSTSTGGVSLARTSSTRSDYSSNFASNSTASFASIASGESGASSATSSTRSARRIIPLYNLQAHNVLTNVIADAGTDAKIARFQKKGLELIDLAVLEPVEVWGIRNRSGEKEARKQGKGISVDETGSIVHAGHGIVNASAIGGSQPSKNVVMLLQPKLGKSDERDRSATTSANSSALSLTSNSTQFSNQPLVVVFAPNHPPSIPPSSAPPYSGTFPSIPNRPPQVPPAIQETTGVAPIAVKKAGNLFGKLKFNSKRQSALNPMTSSPKETSNALSSPPTSPSPSQSQQNQLAQFSMSPLHANTKNNMLSSNSPTSITSQSSNTPTPTPTTPNSRASRHHQDSQDDEGIASPTPTILPPKLNFGANGGDGLPPQVNASARSPISFGGALTRGRNKFISGIKTAATASIVPERDVSPTPNRDVNVGVHPAPPTTGGAKGFFTKIAAGISGNADRNAVSYRGITGSRDDGTSRESVDSNTSLGKAAPYGRLLHHSNSQQFIGTPTASGSTSGNPSPRPSHDLSLPYAQQQQQQLMASSGSAGNLPQTPSSFQSFLPQQGPTAYGNVQLHQLSLRQLQLRPPVLGIQPTYVSASQSYASEHPSALSLTLNNGIGEVGEEGIAGNGTAMNVYPGTGSGNGSGRMVTKMDSMSSFGGTEEGVEIATASSRGGRRRSRPRRDASTRESLNLDRDSLAAAGASNGALSTTGATHPSSKEKESALMYVWLVGRWLKKRGTGGMMSEHTQNASEASVGRNARDLLQNILPGRDKDRGGVNGVLGSEREMKRGSWHAGAGIGMLPSLSGFQSHSAQASSNGYPYVQPLVLGPIVGGGFEVRFEWKRAKTKSRKNRDKERQENAEKRGRKNEKERGNGPLPGRDMAKEKEGENDETPRVTQGPMTDMSPRKMTLAERKRLNRSSVASAISFGDGGSPSRGGSDSPSRRNSSKRNRLSLILGKKDDEDEDGKGNGEDDDDEDSDSEDSETPWVCTLKIRRVAVVKGQQQAGGPTRGVGGLIVSTEDSPLQEQSLRLKVGTLSPTPHHPKVVAMLKVPFPLPDVEVERMEIVKKGIFNNQTGSPMRDEQQQEKEPYHGLTLTSEDIKDIVCSTGLWLVVREGFGGVGKVSRKGDGWKIRG